MTFEDVLRKEMDNDVKVTNPRGGQDTHVSSYRAMAQRISGLARPNFCVYGGGDDVAEWCQRHDVVHVKEYMNRRRAEQ